MAEDHYNNMDMSPGLLLMLGYKRELQGQEGSQDRQVKKEPQVKMEPQEEAIPYHKQVQVKEESQGTAGPQDQREEDSLAVEFPGWMDFQYDLAGKSMTGLEMFTRASVIVDSNGTSWHFTDVEFATLTPSPLRNEPFNNKSPGELSKLIKAWYSHQ